MQASNSQTRKIKTNPFNNSNKSANYQNKNNLGNISNSSVNYISNNEKQNNLPFNISSLRISIPKNKFNIKSPKVAFSNSRKRKANPFNNSIQLVEPPKRLRRIARNMNFTKTGLILPSPTFNNSFLRSNTSQNNGVFQGGRYNLNNVQLNAIRAEKNNLKNLVGGRTKTRKNGRK